MRDNDLREATHRKVLKKHHTEADTLVLDELGVWTGSGRIDIAVVNGKLHGFELKSAKDNLDRLEKQAEQYSSVFDHVTLVVADNHLVEAIELVPDWWGVKKAVEGERGGIRITTERRDRKNPAVDPYRLAQLLWKDEVIDILDQLGGFRGFKSKPRKHLWELLAANVELDQLRSMVRETLKSRTDWRAGSQQ